MLAATRSSGRQTSAGPAGACTHSNASLGLGSGTGKAPTHQRVMSNIIGLGLDATDIDRIADTIDRYGARFLNRIFTADEIAYCTYRRVPAIHFAGRFA